MESEAVCAVLEMCSVGAHKWISSEAVEEELIRDPEIDRAGVSVSLLRFADERIQVDARVSRLAQDLEARGIAAMDAVHLAAAELGTCDVFMTADDRLIRRAAELNPPLKIRVMNPTRWIVGELHHGT